MNAAPRYAHGVTLGPLVQDIATFTTILEGLPPGKVRAVTMTKSGQTYIGAETGLFVIEESGSCLPVPGVPSVPVWRLWPDAKGGVYVATMQDSYHLAPNGSVLTRDFLTANVIGMSQGDDPAFVLTSHTLLDRKRARKVALPEGVTARAIALYGNDAALIATDHGLFRYEGAEITPVSSESVYVNHPGRLLSPDVRDICADGNGGFYLATAKGLNYYTQDSYLEISGSQGLPVLDTRKLMLTPDGALWVATERGIARLSEGRWRYYAGKRWLPSDTVNAMSPVIKGGAYTQVVCVATDGGLAYINLDGLPGDAKRPDHERKAAVYEAITDKRHNRDGFVTDCFLLKEKDAFLYHASDNDGLWTALYIAAESFRYAVTGSEEARQKAETSLHALLELVRVTGIPGFPARTFIRKDERVHQSDPGPNWYPAPVEPDILYKNDTSSDEIDGHYFAWYLYSELVADAAEKARIAETCRAVTNHILDHDYTLVGPTGKHTRWGVWTPDRLNNDPKWAEEKGLNSLEILSHLKVAIHLCGDSRFVEAHEELVRQHGFALNTVTQKRMPPEGECNHSDDELAAVAYYPLLLLETEPSLRSLYLLSLERAWEVLRPEGSPFHNVIYGACTGRPCDAERALQWLYDAPLDLRCWMMTNSHRADVIFNKEIDRFEKPQLTHVLSPRETHVAKWNRNPYLPDGGDEGRSEEEGTFWLLPYWMGRYHGIFVE